MKVHCNFLFGTFFFSVFEKNSYDIIIGRPKKDVDILHFECGTKSYSVEAVTCNLVIHT
jgi:hypothetical protein